MGVVVCFVVGLNVCGDVRGYCDVSENCRLQELCVTRYVMCDYLSRDDNRK
jgi:hypothetical protein